MGGQPANTVSLGLQEGLNGSRWPPVPSIVANIRSTCYIVHVWCLLRPSGVTWSRLGGCPSRQLSGRCTTQGRLWPLNSVAEAHIGEIVRTPNPKTWVWYVLYAIVRYGVWELCVAVYYGWYMLYQHSHAWSFMGAMNVQAEGRGGALGKS